MCSKHYQRAKNYGSPHSLKTSPHGGRIGWLRQQVDHTGDECLIVPFKRANTGYGVVVIGTTHMLAHRWMCEAAHGPAPVGKPWALHRCGRGHDGCVNPRHLYWGDGKDNEADRARHGTSNQGERNGQAKLTEEDVRAIRAAPPRRGIRRALAARYGVAVTTIMSIRSRAIWGWLT